MKILCALAATLALILFANTAQATMEAAWNNGSDSDNVVHEKPKCPNFIMIKHKDGSTEEHVFAHQILNNRSSVDAGECVFY